MKKCNEKFATLSGDIGISAAAEEFREYIRERARDVIIGVMASEVELLCSLLHQPKVGGEFYRSGSAPGYILHEGRHLRRADQPELSCLFNRLWKAEGELAGREALSELDGFLSSRNAVALASFREAGEELICLHHLNVTSTLNVSFLSTNIIENPFRNVRRKLGRVCRWRTETNQASRWLAMALLEAENGPPSPHFRTHGLTGGKCFD